jgi:hypothetical protein
MNDYKGIVGAAVTVTGGAMSWLPMVNEVVQITAGLVAIVVGIVTIRHYHRKDKKL